MADKIEIKDFTECQCSALDLLAINSDIHYTSHSIDVCVLLHLSVFALAKHRISSDQ